MVFLSMALDTHTPSLPLLLLHLNPCRNVWSVFWAMGHRRDAGVDTRTDIMDLSVSTQQGGDELAQCPFTDCEDCERGYLGSLNKGDYLLYLFCVPHLPGHPGKPSTHLLIHSFASFLCGLHLSRDDSSLGPLTLSPKRSSESMEEA